jgi:hypothetical protein
MRNIHEEEGKMDEINENEGKEIIKYYDIKVDFYFFREMYKKNTGLQWLSTQVWL